MNTKLTLIAAALIGLMGLDAMAWVTPPPPAPPGGGGRPAPYPGGPGHNPGHPGPRPGPGYPGPRPGPGYPPGPVYPGPRPTPPPYYPPAPRPVPVTRTLHAWVQQNFSGYNRLSLEQYVNMRGYNGAIIRSVTVHASTDYGSAEINYCSYENGCDTRYVNSRYVGPVYFFDRDTRLDYNNYDVTLETRGNLYIQSIEVELEYYR